MSNFSQKTRQNPVSLQKGGSEQGVSLYLAIMIMSILLAIVLGMSAVLFYQLKMVGEMGNSVVAFYAADTGIENALYDETQCLLQTDTSQCNPGGLYPLCKTGDDSDNYCNGVVNNYNTNNSPTKVQLLDNWATYEAEFTLTGGFQSKGSFHNTKRAIEISY